MSAPHVRSSDRHPGHHTIRDFNIIVGTGVREARVRIEVGVGYENQLIDTANKATLRRI
jgi:hypothetical protein